MLQRDVRHLAVIYGVSCAGSGVNFDLLHLLSVKRMTLADVVNGIERRLDRTSGRPLLQSSLGYTIQLAKLIDHSCGISFGIVSLHEIIRPGEDIIRTAPPEVDHESRIHAIPCSHRAVQ